MCLVDDEQVVLLSGLYVVVHDVRGIQNHGWIQSSYASEDILEGSP